MPFKLSTRSIHDTPDSAPAEQYFNQDLVTIGRRDFNDVQLNDRRRLVSSRHAEIRKKDNLFLLVDVGSKNGTYLNEARLDVGSEYPLTEDDQIAIGEFLIQIHLLAEEASKEEAWVGRVDSTTFVLDVSEEVEDIAADLNRIYWENAGADPEERKILMVEALLQALKGRDEVNTEKILDLIECLFPDPEYQREKVLQGPSNLTTECSQNEYEAYKKAYDGLMKIAGRYIENTETLHSPEVVEKLVDRIDRGLEIMINCLGSAIQGRRKFEQEFDVEATRIFSWKPNPIKFAEEGRDIGKYLLDWRKGETIDKIASDLEDAFTDLALHQMGLMAGFKECLRGVLAQLDPASFESETRSASLELGPLKIPGKFLPLARGMVAWNRFREKHRELSEEEVKTFETILGPHFAKGYLSIQEKKK